MSACKLPQQQESHCCWQAGQCFLQHGAVCSSLLSCQGCLAKLAVSAPLQPESRQHPALMGIQQCIAARREGYYLKPGLATAPKTTSSILLVVLVPSGRPCPKLTWLATMHNTSAPLQSAAARSASVNVSKSSRCGGLLLQVKGLLVWQSRPPLPAVCVTSLPDHCLCRAAALLGNLEASPVRRSPWLLPLACAAA